MANPDTVLTRAAVFHYSTKVLGQVVVPWLWLMAAHLHHNYDTVRFTEKGLGL
jgi:hypothetical protein